MKYNVIGFSQQKAMELRLDVKDLIILKHIIDFINSGKMVEREIDGETYYWLKQDRLLEELPILNIGGSTVLRRRLKKLVKFNILKYYLMKKGGTYTLYGKGSELNNLLYKKVGDVKVGNNTTKRSIKDDLKVRPKDNINKNIIANNIKSAAIEIIDFLNILSNSKYKWNSVETLNLIRDRIEEGYSVEDFKEVILKKYNEWSGTIYAKYIRPSTLFKEGKFDEYLNQKRVDNNKEEIKENNNVAFCDFVID
ncbi:conserved phage C-terminal domain-containing protein [Clostridium baratii]|uniref:conserved phage C-terminal domain-containing protein n=1 Tax=Clostridium baratii TaxID=1561 RepID=UPI002A75C0CC|nr:conserved phage C-terminal domain-containing protein [Clostridium baratii]MDY3206060.1 conserved phage C-terminal domain-containing protein [Clostridium baratii]